MSEQPDEPENDERPQQWVFVLGHVRDEKPCVMLRMFDGDPQETEGIKLMLTVNQTDALVNLLWESRSQAINAYVQRKRMFDELDQDLEAWSQLPQAEDGDPLDP